MRNIRRLSVLFASIALVSAGCSTADAARPPVLVVVAEGGQPLPQRDLAALEVLVAETLAVGGSLDVFVVSGPNSDVLRPLDLPGLTVDGRLDTTARNGVARERDLDERLPGLIGAIEDAVLVPVGNGRDLHGAVVRAGGGDHDRLVVFFTSGGIHRTNELDFLVDIPPPSPWGLRPDLAVELWGVGDVPVPEGEVPDRAFTQGLIEHWTGACELHGANCEVIR